MTVDKMFSLQGRQALIIGGTSGIGREIALGYRAAGAQVAVAGRTAAKLDAMSKELDDGSGRRTAFEADVSNCSAIADLFNLVETEAGPVDILVNSQGTTEIKPALDFTEAEYDRVVDTNLKSVFFCCTEAGRRMAERGGGSIINIASLAAHYGWARATPYSISKAGVASLTSSLASEWGPHGIRVNGISPGFFLTDLNRERMTAERRAQATARTAMGRFGELEELVGAAVYLASPSAGFVTGETIRVDGGFLASGI